MMMFLGAIISLLPYGFLEINKRERTNLTDVLQVAKLNNKLRKQLYLLKQEI